jgi:hypothetical protein
MHLHPSSWAKDNLHLGRRTTFILGGVVPAFAVGGKRWGELVSGGSAVPALQRLAVAELHDLQLTGNRPLFSENLKKFQKVSKSFKKFQKV